MNRERMPANGPVSQSVSKGLKLKRLLPPLLPFSFRNYPPVGSEYMRCDKRIYEAQQEEAPK